MATKFTKPVRRELEISDLNGVSGDVVVTLTAHGLSFRAKGKQRELTLNWKEMNKLLVLPMKAPARFSGNPLGWLIEK